MEQELLNLKLEPAKESQPHEAGQIKKRKLEETKKQITGEKSDEATKVEEAIQKLRDRFETFAKISYNKMTGIEKGIAMIENKTDTALRHMEEKKQLEKKEQLEQQETTAGSSSQEPEWLVGPQNEGTRYKYNPHKKFFAHQGRGGFKRRGWGGFNRRY